MKTTESSFRRSLHRATALLLIAALCYFSLVSAPHANPADENARPALSRLGSSGE